MSSLGWSSVQPSSAALSPGETVAAVVSHYGFWSPNACRMVYVIDDDDRVRRIRRRGVSRRVVIWLIPILLALHNAEEAMTFRRYAPRVAALLPPTFASVAARLTPASFVLALAVLTLLAFVLALLADVRPQSQRRLWLLLALQAAIGLNVLAHVFTAAVVLRGYGPGLATALMLNAPFTVYCFLHARRERWVSAAALRATVPMAFVLHGPVLLAGLWLAASLSR